MSQIYFQKFHMKIKNLIIYLILFLSYLAQCYYIDYSFVKGKQDRNCVKNQLESINKLREKKSVLI